MGAILEAYVTNLGKYAEGQLVGETLKFPTTTEEVQALLKRIGVDGVRYEEIFITSFDSDVLGLHEHLGEYENIDELARKWNVDYAFYKAGPDKYLLFFKSGQADAITACFSEYSKKVLNKSKSRRTPIREQLKQGADQLAKDKPHKRERVKEAAHENR